MNQTTQKNYRTRAENFYQSNLKGITPSPKKICDALKEKSNDMKPNSWRVLRNAIEFDQRQKGFIESADRVKSQKNPNTLNGKQNRLSNRKPTKVKNITEVDEQKLLRQLKTDDNKTLLAAIRLVKYLGCRPAELLNIEFLQSNSIRIPSAKKREDRGLDRVIKLEGNKAKQLYDFLESQHQELLSSGFTDPVRYAQKRLLTVGKQLWPQRKSVPCLYSWRHQMGADLKASGKSRREIAALMGHLSVESISVYGRPRHARNQRSYISAHADTIAKVLNKEPSIPPSKVSRTVKSIKEKSAKGGGRATTNKSFPNIRTKLPIVQIRSSLIKNLK